jgi:hypothetical protein
VDGYKLVIQRTEQRQAGDKDPERAVDRRARDKAEQETTRRRNEKSCIEEKLGETVRKGRQDNKTR